jgi:hypothetical protein
MTHFADAIAWVPSVGLVSMLLITPASAQTVNTTQLETNLQAAVCLNHWDQALKAIAPLIGSPGVSDQQRQELIQFRYQLENWRAVGAEFGQMPNCQGQISVTTPQAQAPQSSLNWQHAIQNVQDATSNPQQWLPVERNFANRDIVIQNWGILNP